MSIMVECDRTDCHAHAVVRDVAIAIGAAHEDRDADVVLPEGWMALDGVFEDDGTEVVITLCPVHADESFAEELYAAHNAARIAA